MREAPAKLTYSTRIAPENIPLRLGRQPSNPIDVGAFRLDLTIFPPTPHPSLTSRVLPPSFSALTVDSTFENVVSEVQKGISILNFGSVIGLSVQIPRVAPQI